MLEDTWRSAVRADDIAVVAIANDIIVGVAHAHGHRIVALYVRAGHCRRGIGSRLLSAVLAAMSARGVREAEFNVLAINAGAIGFYQAFGAQAIGRGTGKDRGDMIFTLLTDATRLGR